MHVSLFKEVSLWTLLAWFRHINNNIKQTLFNLSLFSGVYEQLYIISLCRSNRGGGLFLALAHHSTLPPLAAGGNTGVVKHS